MNSKTVKMCLLIMFLAGFVSCIYDREFNEPLKICFVRSGNIWVMDIDGDNQEQLTSSGLDSYPSWSPDGMKIVFQSMRYGNEDIFIMNHDGSEEKQLTFTTAPDYCMYPTWLPDGDRIIFLGSRSATLYIFIISDKGTVKEQFSDGGLTLTTSSCSPDGEYAVFSCSTTLSRMNTSTGVFTTVTSSAFPSGHSWSPDGKEICFSDGGNLYIGDPMGSDSYYSIYAGTAYDLCWTPDGKRIIFTTNPAGGDIYSIRPDGTDLKTISTGSDMQPCVQGKPR